MTIASLHSVPSAASWHPSVNTHTQYRLPHTHVLILKENSPYMCTLKQQKPSHWNGIWKTPLVSRTLHPSLSLSLSPRLSIVSLSHASPRTSGWASLTSQYRNVPFQAFTSFHVSVCLLQWGGSWQPIKEQPVSSSTEIKKKGGTDPFWAEWFVFPPFCVLCSRFWPLLMW